VETSRLDRSAVILAGSFSEEFGQDKGLVKLGDKPLLNYVVDSVAEFVDEIIIVTNSKKRADAYAKIVSPNVRFIAGDYDSILAAAEAGLETAKGTFCALLPFDAPFISHDLLSLLFECSGGKSAVVPRTPDNEVEALLAVYNREKALEAAKNALANNETDVVALVACLRGVRYLSTLVVEQFDPDLRSFFTVKTSFDLKKAVVMLKPKEHKTKSKR
jgi:molybdopterin-guanine dinucleotide biosynthesis protein A